ncbi:MAG: hypothetical protein WCH07_04415 [Deltaproteobacteria bacterium]
MNMRNELNEKQAVLPFIPGPEHEWFDRATQEDVDNELTCRECYEPMNLNDPFVKVTLFDSPFNKEGHEEAFHVENGENGYDSCYDRLTDTGWADFRYFECPGCLRMVCRQNPRNGWHVQIREIGDEDFCLRCYEEEVFEKGIDRESFEDGKISGMFLNDSDLTAAGFVEVDGFMNVHITSKQAADYYCKEALRLIDEGFKVVTNYERMGIGGIEGYVSMWIKDKNLEGAKSCMK